jgi:reverse gyrase
MNILKIFKKFKCYHEFITVSNFYGDYINYISSGFPVYRSRQRCIKCGKQRLSEYLDENCKTINDSKER